MATSHAAKRCRLLAINGCATMEGDIFTMVMLLEMLPPDEYEMWVATKPRGEVYERLRHNPNIHLIEMEMGGSEGRAPGRTGPLTELKEVVGAIRRLRALVKRERIDVIYTIDRTVAPQVASIVSRLTGRPHVLCAAYPYYGMQGPRQRMVLRGARRIQAHSRFLVERLAPYVRDASSMRIIQYCIPLDRYDPAKSGAPLRARYGIEPGHAVVAMAGRLNPYKGQSDLIEAAAHVLREMPDTWFLIGGRGPELAALQERIDRLGVGHRVKMVGYVADLTDLYAAADIVAMPSHEEPFGLVALEGMAMGKPIVSTRAGGVPEFVIEGEVGLLTPPCDPAALAQSILTLLRDPEMARRMGQAGRLRAETVQSPDAYLDAVDRLIHDAAA